MHIRLQLNLSKDPLRIFGWKSEKISQENAFFG